METKYAVTHDTLMLHKKVLRTSVHHNYHREPLLQKSFVFLTVHHSIDLFHLPTLMHNSFIH
jgi:hypothetical protein